MFECFTTQDRQGQIAWSGCATASSARSCELRSVIWCCILRVFANYRAQEQLMVCPIAMQHKTVEECKLKSKISILYAQILQIFQEFCLDIMRITALSSIFCRTKCPNYGYFGVVTLGHFISNSGTNWKVGYKKILTLKLCYSTRVTLVLWCSQASVQFASAVGDCLESF